MNKSLTPENAVQQKTQAALVAKTVTKTMTKTTEKSAVKLAISLTAMLVCGIALSISSITADAAEAPAAKLVSVENAKIEQVNPSIWLPGNVISRKNAPISAEQTGQLLWLEEVGSEVNQGQVIAKLDNRHLKLQLARQQAQVRQQQAEVNYLAKQKKRMSALSKKNATAISELERITKDLAVAENEVTALSMQVEQTKLNIEKSTILAPFSGSISERFANIGELMTPGRPLLQLVDTEHLDIKIAAPLAIAPYLQQNNKVLVKWQDNLIELPIRTWSQAGDQASRTFDVRLAANQLELLAGTAVTVSLPKSAEQKAILVPRDALILREKDTFVLTLDNDNKAQKISVLVGQGVGRWVSVTGTIKAGQAVVVRGGETLQAGQKVRVDNSLIAKVP